MTGCLLDQKERKVECVYDFQGGDIIRADSMRVLKRRAQAGLRWNKGVCASNEQERVESDACTCQSQNECHLALQEKHPEF
ncbi:MAG: hypothetical protein A2X48_22165 [Lentisphaerae bacterium GWF2_49_21]|nr:MAG: hypothetical protein A2X48_22165 [Lentisphaerae bacterium GWF2_49_21]